MSKKLLKQKSAIQSEKLTFVATELSDKDLEKFVGGTSITYGGLGGDRSNQPSGNTLNNPYHRACLQVTRCSRG